MSKKKLKKRIRALEAEVVRLMVENARSCVPLVLRDDPDCPPGKAYLFDSRAWRFGKDN